MFGEDHVDHREQEQRVGAGPDEQMPIGCRGRFGAAWIDDDDAAAAGAQIVQALAHVGRRHDAAVGDERVGADAEKEIRPVEIRYGHQQAVTEHVVRRHHVRKLVDRAGRIQILRSEVPQEQLTEGDQAEAMSGGIALIDGDRVRTVSLADPIDLVHDAIECIVPRRLAPGAVDADERAPQAVRVVVEVRERRGFRTDISLAERIVSVSADGNDPVAVDLDRDAAGGFTEGAGQEVQRCYPANREHRTEREHEPRTVNREV